MNIHLTTSLFGKKLKTIAEGVATFDNALYAIDVWKESNSDKYKVEPYTQFTIEDKRIGVDFGDYCTFMVIDHITSDEWNSIKDRLSKNTAII